MSTPEQPKRPRETKFFLGMPGDEGTWTMRVVRKIKDKTNNVRWRILLRDKHGRLGAMTLPPFLAAWFSLGSAVTFRARIVRNEDNDWLDRPQSVLTDVFVE